MLAPGRVVRINILPAISSTASITSSHSAACQGSAGYSPASAQSNGINRYVGKPTVR
jgi:hypothetical protein